MNLTVFKHSIFKSNDYKACVVHDPDVILLIDPISNIGSWRESVSVRLCVCQKIHIIAFTIKKKRKGEIMSKHKVNFKVVILYVLLGVEFKRIVR